MKTVEDKHRQMLILLLMIFVVLVCIVCFYLFLLRFIVYSYGFSVCFVLFVCL